MTTSDEARVWHNISGAKSWVMPEFEVPDKGAEDAPPAEEAVEPRPPSAADLDALHKRAHEEGYAKGYAEGLANAEEAMNAAIERLRIIAAELASPLEELDRDLEYSLSNLALILARRIVGKAVREDPDSLHSLVQQAVEMLGNEVESPVEIYLNPTDLRFLTETLGPDSGWNLHPDTSLQSGDVRVKRGLAEVDGRLQQRLDRLAAEMLNA